MPGPELRLGGPITAAEEEYANRAYPAADIPFTATLNAQAAFNQVKARGNSKKNQAGQWSLIGPSSANAPNILTFSGAAYTTSGRITALAIAPNCGQGHCYLYVAAAGGGIWRTDKALHTNPSQKWDFLSDSFGTNAIGALIIDPTDPTGNTLYAGTGEPNVSVDSEAGVGIYKTTDGGNTWTHLASQIGPITTNSAQGSTAHTLATRLPVVRFSELQSIQRTRASFMFVCSRCARRQLNRRRRQQGIRRRRDHPTVCLSRPTEARPSLSSGTATERIAA